VFEKLDLVHGNRSCPVVVNILETADQQVALEVFMDRRCKADAIRASTNDGYIGGSTNSRVIYKKERYSRGREEAKQDIQSPTCLEIFLGPRSSRWGSAQR
jgi:hypothetical protein